MRLYLISGLIGIFNTTMVIAQTPLSADEIVKTAQVEAAKEKKNVFIIFHASWCMWCHRMDSSLNDKSCKEFFNNNYVIRHLVVKESKVKKNLENPGALELLTKYKGAELGIPFWLIFDQDGNLLADSRMSPGVGESTSTAQNCGCPATKEEVTYFISVLKKTSSINDQQAAIIEERFRQNER